MTNQEKIKLVESYIYKRKNVRVKINEPKDHINLFLLNKAVETADSYFKEIHKKDM